MEEAVSPQRASITATSESPVDLCAPAGRARTGRTDRWVGKFRVAGKSQKVLLTTVAAALLIATTPLVVIGCATSGVNQGDLNLVSIEEEWALGARLEQDLAKQLDLVNDSAVSGYVNRLGQALVAQTEMANLPWKFHVVSDAQINAFNIPGGHVYVNTGLIKAAGNASQLAGVMAHEISHGVARHGTEQLSKSYGLNILAGIALGGDPATYQKILAQVVGSGTLARFSRQAEGEADTLGVRTMYAANYNPRGMAEIFEKLLAQRKSRPGAVQQFFSSHPLTEDRISSVRQQSSQLPKKSGLITTDPAFNSAQKRVGP